uniref:Uncharacterized protein n=1 Tax=Myotis myotis TaxID=51298 RepID=A0A7J7VJ33_MYOMY|nr:hypothetical protein mMyoMyo1_008392 [Myotis myotis]
MRLCSFSFLCKWGKYCVLYIIIDLFFPFNNRETHLICFVVFLNMNVSYFSCSDTDGHFQSFDVSHSTVLSSPATPAIATGWSVSQGRDQEVEFLGHRTGWQCSLLPCRLPSREMYKFPYLSTRLSVHMLNTLQSKLQFLPVAFDVSCIHSDSETLTGTMGSWHLCAERLRAKR